MSVKSLNVLSGIAFAALLFVSLAAPAEAKMAGAAAVPVDNPTLAAQNAVVQGG